MNVDNFKLFRGAFEVPGTVVGNHCSIHNAIRSDILLLGISDVIEVRESGGSQFRKKNVGRCK